MHINHDDLYSHALTLEPQQLVLPFDGYICVNDMSILVFGEVLIWEQYSWTGCSTKINEHTSLRVYVLKIEMATHVNNMNLIGNENFNTHRRHVICVWKVLSSTEHYSSAILIFFQKGLGGGVIGIKHLGKLLVSVMNVCINNITVFIFIFSFLLYFLCFITSFL